MALLGAIAYDPATAVSESCASLLAMTAVDTTNCRVTFTAPAAGAGTGTRDVLVRIQCTVRGGSTTPVILLGVLEGSTVIARQAPIGGRYGNATTSKVTMVAEFVVPNISSGSHSWDLAYGVEVNIASSSIDYGGPNNTTANDAWGAITMEVWETPNLLAAANHDPSTKSSVSTTSPAKAMAALDTTNLRVTFTAPASGNVLVKVRPGSAYGSTTWASILLGVLESSTVVARQAPMGSIAQIGALASTDKSILQASLPVLGISAGSHTYDAAWGVETVSASTAIEWGGPNDTTTNNAFGMASIEVWAA